MEIIIFKYLHYQIYLLEGKDYIAMVIICGECTDYFQPIKLRRKSVHSHYFNVY